MFSDTHFHFRQTCANSTQGFVKDFLHEMALEETYFGMDVGTLADDLKERGNFFLKALNNLEEEDKSKIKKMIHFSAGIWPDLDSIKNRFAKMEILKNQIEEFKKEANPFCKKLAAIGEGGLDHHWNPAGADGRNEADFDRETYFGEKELFHMQLHLAKELNLPFIVHSRDAFQGTLEVLKSAGSTCGIIHCYSYGIEEARHFLDLGYHISLSGSQTYTKKNKMEECKALIQYIPDDRLLLETDSPYLTPVPFRGKTTNNPSLVKYTYAFVAQIKGITMTELSSIVDKNCHSLFKLTSLP